MSETAPVETVVTEREGHVARIRFAAPPHNFASPELLALIADALDACDADPEVRCAVLLAEGRSFCAGANLAGDADSGAAAHMATIGRLYVQAERLFRRKTPMVAGVAGAAIGAGLGLALTADFRVAGPRARFSANFVRLGFHPGFALTHTLPWLIGPQRAGWMMLSAERTRPEDALAWGLVDRVVEEDAVEKEAMRMAQAVADNAPLALAAVRATLSDGLGDAVAAAMRHEHAQQTALRSTSDYTEGVASVFERRDARFTGT